jgi:two-component system, OmpR family, response regulator
MAGSRSHVLVIEDWPQASSLRSRMRRMAIRLISPSTAMTGSGAASEYAVMTIDRTLPEIVGVAIIRRLSEGGIAMPALIISAHCEV